MFVRRSILLAALVPLTACQEDTFVLRAVDRYHQGGRVEESPQDLSGLKRPCVLQNLMGDGRWNEKHGVLDAPGTCSFDHVPEGPVYVWAYGFWLHTRARTAEVGTDLPGRPELRGASGQADFRLALEGLRPWRRDANGLQHFLTLCIPEAGQCGTELAEASMLDEGGTSFAKDVRLPGLDFSRGESMFVTQWEGQPLSLIARDGTPLGYRWRVVAGAAVGAESATEQEEPKTLAVQLNAGPLADVELPLEARDFDSLSFRVGPFAMPHSGVHTVGVARHVVDGQLLPPLQMLASLEVKADPAASGHQEHLDFLSPLGLSNPLARDGVLVHTWSRSFTLKSRDGEPIEGERPTVFSRRRLSEQAQGPLVGPVDGVSLDGVPVSELTGMPGSTPTLSWSPPGTGSAHAYAIMVYRPADEAPYSVLVTKETSVRLPPALLPSAGKVRLVVRAAHLPGIDVEQQPRFNPLEMGWADASTDWLELP